MTSIDSLVNSAVPFFRWSQTTITATVSALVLGALDLKNGPSGSDGCASTSGLGPVGVAGTGRAGSAVLFFCADTVKIALLLVGIIFVVTVLRSFMSLERTRAMLGGKREGVGNVMAASLGVVTPFCSCSAVPAFIGFVAAGIPIGVTMSFLIASPLVN